MQYVRATFALAAFVILAAACGEGQQGARALTEAESAALAPAHPRLAELYETSCKACHTVRASLAPLAGDRTQWDARWAAGEDALLRAAITGKNGMPAGGQCVPCTPDDLRGLTRFMAAREDG